MTRIDIDFSIKNEERKQSFKSKGDLDNNTMRFTDDNGQKHDLKVVENRLHYQRSGDPSFTFVFEKGVSHVGRYQIGHQTIPMNVETHHMKTGDGVITVTYTLKQEDIIIGHTTFTIKYNESKEEHE